MKRTIIVNRYKNMEMRLPNNEIKTECNFSDAPFATPHPEFESCML